LEQARRALNLPRVEDLQVNIERLSTWQRALETPTGRDPSVCSRCGGLVEHKPLLAQARAPPGETLAT
jgi:hypothetical protein